MILIGPARTTLLFRGGDPRRPEVGTWWFTPGGGAHPGESPGDAAVRELWEETGATDVEWGPLVARRRTQFSFEGRRYRSDEWYWVAYTDRHRVVPGRVDEVEARSVVEHRWIGPDAMRRLDEIVYPEPLADAIDALAVRRFPATPWMWTSRE